MEISLFLAKLVGIMSIVIYAGLLLNAKKLTGLMDDFVKSPSLIYLSGFIALIFGLVLVLLHNIWVADWIVIITVFGWLALVKGIVLILWPDTAIKTTGIWKKNTGLLMVASLIMAAIGLFLTIKGFALL